MKKKISAILCTGLLIFAAAGCSSNAANTVTPSATTSASKDTLSQTVLTGKVTAINDDKVTIALMTKEEPSSATPNVGDGSNQTLASSPKAADSTPAATSGQSQVSSLPGYKLTGETKTITVSSDTVITNDLDSQKVSATISDIAVDDFLTVTMTGTTVSAILIKNAIAPPATADMDSDSGSSTTAGVNAQSSASAGTHSSNTISSNS